MAMPGYCPFHEFKAVTHLSNPGRRKQLKIDCAGQVSFGGHLHQKHSAILACAVNGHCAGRSKRPGGVEMSKSVSPLSVKTRPKANRGPDHGGVPAPSMPLILLPWTPNGAWCRPPCRA